MRLKTMKISKLLADKYSISVRAAKSYIKNGLAEIDGSIIKKDIEYEHGELILKAETERPRVNPADYIAKEYDYIVYFHKPPFMHTDLHKPDDPLTMQDVLSCCKEEYSFISRLDYTTDGIIAAVWNGFFVFETKKVYLAYAEGKLEKETVVDNLIDADKRKKVRVTEKIGGFRTVFTPVSYEDKHTLVRCEMEQAARHQLRAYLAHLGHPIAGDGLYGSGGMDRIYLHCAETYINRFPGESAFIEDFKNSFRKIKQKI